MLPFCELALNSLSRAKERQNLLPPHLGPFSPPFQSLCPRSSSRPSAMLSRQSRRLGLSLDSNLRLGLASSRRTGILNHDWHPTRVRLAVPSLAPRPVPLVAALVRRSSALHLVRSFHSTSPRRDILFVSAPLFKQTLLYLVRVSLVSIPFLWRYKVFARFPRQTRWLVWVPLCALSLVVALGLDQSERTSRWRLLLMSDREEVEWSNQRSVTHPSFFGGVNERKKKKELARETFEY